MISNNIFRKTGAKNIQKLSSLTHAVMRHQKADHNDTLGRPLTILSDIAQKVKIFHQLYASV